MKIVEMIPNLALGGAERFVTDLCNALVKEGNQVVLITLFDIKEKDSFFPLLSKEVKCICLNKKKGRISLLLPFVIFLILLRERPSVVHTHLNCFIYSILSWLILRNIRFFHTIHNDAFKEAGSSLELKMKRMAFGRLVTPVTISDESKNSFYKLYQRESFLIYNGRQVEKENLDKEKDIEEEIKKIKSNPKSMLVVNLARFAAQKNQLSLVKAVNKFNEKDPRIELIIIGSYLHSQDAIDIYNNIQKIETPQIHIIGARTDAACFLRFADAFCLSSIYEGMPISVIESFAYGCPVLSTPVGGVVNMVKDGENGMLSKNAEVDSIVSMLERFYNTSDEDKLKMKINAKNAYELYSMSECVKKYLSYFAK